MPIKVKHGLKTLIMYQIYIDYTEKSKISKQMFFYQHPLANYFVIKHRHLNDGIPVHSLWKVQNIETDKTLLKIMEYFE